MRFINLIRNFLTIIKNKNYNIRYKFIKKRKIETISELPSFNEISNNVLDYVDSLKANDGYYFSRSSKKVSIYSNVYALLLHQLIDKNCDIEIIDKIYNLQLSDGLFYDKNCLNSFYVSGEGWGARHFLPHVLPIFVSFPKKLKYDFNFLNRFDSKEKVDLFFDNLNYEKIWAESNIIMNYCSIVQYVRDFKNIHKFDDILKYFEEKLKDNIIPELGAWFKRKKEFSKQEKYETIRGAYHIYLIFEYDRLDFKYKNEVIDLILSLQNKNGGFDFNSNSSACMDIDAVDPLIRFSLDNSYRKKEVEKCLLKFVSHALANQRKDKGFCFELFKSFNYGHSSLCSKKGESNLFATWFRYLSLLEIYEYFNVIKIRTKDVPGYQCLLK